MIELTVVILMILFYITIKCMLALKDTDDVIEHYKNISKEKDVK